MGINLNIVSCPLMLAEETTDVGSSASDAESTCSSTSSSLGGPRRRQPTALHGRFFDGTPLETIPGTPIGQSEQQGLYSLFPPQHKPHVPMSPPMAPPPPPLTVPTAVKQAVPPSPLSHLPALPQQSPTVHFMENKPKALFTQGSFPMTLALPCSPKRRARNALITKAQKEAIPLRVLLPDDNMLGSVPLNPTLPAKKRPLPEFASLTAMTLQELEPGLPAKKQETPFLVEDTLRILLPPPGLVIAPR